MSPVIKERLSKFLSQAGVASRRKADELILAGKIKVNGQVVNTLGAKIDPQNDQVMVHERLIAEEAKVYYILNKPRDYVCSVADPYNHKNVLQLVPKNPKVWPVGRLDKDSRGLLILTNDGDLTNQLTHPRYEKKKKYIVRLHKQFLKSDLAVMKEGVELDEGMAQVDAIKILAENILEITIHQGWKRQIRRMLRVLGYRVIDLCRVQEGKIALGDLADGTYKKVELADIL